MDISYYEEIKVLGLHIRNTTHASATKCWNVLTSRIRAQAQDTYQRALDLDQRIRYIQECLLARAWYMAQILPPPEDNLRQISITISWFLWKEELFLVPFSTLQRTNNEGGWGTIHSAAKCMALLFQRMREQGKKNGTVTADRMKRWGLQEQTKNPPYAGRTPTTLEYLHRYDMESAYLAPNGRDETTQAYKNRLYMTIHTIMRATAGDHEMRVTKKWPHIDWERVWDNLSEAPLPESTRIAWFRVIHEIIPTNERLQRIRMVQMDTCRNCTMKDTLEHGITACREGRAIWKHSKSLIIRVLRTIPTRIPDDWLLHPQIQI